MATAEKEQTVEEEMWAFCDRVVQSAGGGLDLLAIYFGHKLGLYQALVDGGTATSGELAQRAGIHERYAREWLEHQAISEVVRVDDPTKDAQQRRYELPPGHAISLTDADSLGYSVSLAEALVEVGPLVPQLLDAYRNGTGLTWPNYGEWVVHMQEGLSRPLHKGLLTKEWLPSLPEVDARLRAGARVADIACGTGLAAIEIARAYPEATVAGFDFDEAAIAKARKNAADAGVADRVTFEVADARALDGKHKFDVVTIFESLHDMSRPAEALRSIRKILAEDGIFLVIEEATGKSFAEPGDMDRMFYGISLFYCLPPAMEDPDPSAIGTVIREEKVRELASEAGFSAVEILPIEHFLWRFYRLTP